MTKKTLISLIVIIIMILLSIWAFVFSKTMMGDVELNHDENMGDEQITIKELVITETKEGKKFWEVYADYGKYNNGNDVAVLNNITGNFYKDDEVVMSVMSPKALFNNLTKEVTLFGGAQAANNKNVYIQANEILWAGAKNEVTARGNVKIFKQEDGIMTESDESTFDTDFTNMELSGDANTYVYPTVYGNLK